MQINEAGIMGSTCPPYTNKKRRRIFPYGVSADGVCVCTVCCPPCPPCPPCPLLSACPPVFIFDMYMGFFDTGGQQLLSAAFYLSALKSPIYQGFGAFGGQADRADSRWVKIVLLSA